MDCESIYPPISEHFSRFVSKAKQGISKRFLSYFQSLDTSLGARALGPGQTLTGKAQDLGNTATQQAKAVDEQRGLSKMANDVSEAFTSFNNSGLICAKYYTRAISSPLGQKVKEFYTTTSKQVVDIHEEARRLAAEQKNAAAGAPAAAPGSVPGGAAGSAAIPPPTNQAAPTIV